MKFNVFIRQIAANKWLRVALISGCAFLLYILSFTQLEERFLSNRITADNFSRVVVPELNAENVYRELLAQGIQFPEIVVKQSILETGWYKCTYCSLASNNIFGFRKNKKYIEFDTWVEGVAYYKEWQDNYYKGGSYYVFLKKIGYAVSEQYEQKLKTIVLDFDVAAIHAPSMHLRKLFISLVEGMKDFGKNA
jgi:hypothetical protein